jgi:opacity protein-like surface antigen
MKQLKTIGVVIIVLSFCLVGSSVLAAEATSKDKAVKAARAWLGAVDQGKYAASWDKAAAFFKKSITKKKWQEALTGVRKPLGKMLKRELLGAKPMTDLPKAPKGEYVVIQFKTSYEKKKDAIETITPMKEKDGSWKVSGYFIK